MTVFPRRTRAAPRRARDAGRRARGAARGARAGAAAALALVVLLGTVGAGGPGPGRARAADAARGGPGDGASRDAGGAARTAPEAPIARRQAGVPRDAGAATAARVTDAAAPAPADGQAAPAQAPVRLRERSIFVLRAPLAGRPPADRARAATVAIERLAQADEPPTIRFEVRGELATVFAGGTPLVQLGPADAAAAGEGTLAMYAASVTSKVAEALSGERRRKAIASTVFSISLLVFSGLIAVLLLRKSTELFERGRRWITEHPHEVPALRVLSLDLVRPAAVRAGLTVALGLGRLLVQIGIGYTWLLFALSLFEGTRLYGARLTGFVVSPLSALVARIGSSIPLVLVAAVAIVAVIILLRFVGLFFGSVARGEMDVSFVPRDLAVPTGLLVRVGIIVVALLLAAPLITGSDDGSLSRAGLAALVALGFSCAPVLASVAVGIPVVFGRRLRVGDVVEVGGRTGTVRAVDLLEVKLSDDFGGEVRVPHLAGLFQPTRIVGRARLVSVTVAVDPRVRQADVRALLLERARRFGVAARVTLERLDAGGAHYRITAPVSAGDGEDLACSIADALAEAGVPLASGATVGGGGPLAG